METTGDGVPSLTLGISLMIRNAETGFDSAQPMHRLLDL